MPLLPTAAQSATSRANGALSRGPATPEGKARSALNGTRHGLAGPFRLLPGEDAAAYGRLRAALLARHAPADAAEEHWVEELAFAAWRLRRLRALDAADGTSEPEPQARAEPDEAARLPSLATLARYRGRVERDRRQALQALESLCASRPRLPATVASATPSQLRWLADRAERTAEPEHPAQAEPERPAPAPAAPPLNRQQRRRLAALERQRSGGYLTLSPDGPACASSCHAAT
jgi:hypothetical protein